MEKTASFDLAIQEVLQNLSGGMSADDLNQIKRLEDYLSSLLDPFGTTGKEKE